MRSTFKPCSRNDGAYPGEMICGNRPAENGDDKLILALRRDPVIQVSLRDGCEIDLQPQLSRLCQQGVLQAAKALTSWNLDQQTKRERFVDDCLSNIQHAGVILARIAVNAAVSPGRSRPEK